MRFDGYYILLDFLGIPNLGTKGQQFLKWFGKRFLLGMKDLPMPPAVRQHPVAVPVYGVLAALWKIIIWIGIMVLVSLLFKGAGFVIAIASVAVMLITALVKFFRFLFTAGKGPQLSSALPRLGILLAIIAGVLFLVPINPTGKAIAVVEYSDKETLRASVRGFVTEVGASEGELVKEGDVLVQLSNPDEKSEYDKLVLELRSSRIRARSFYQTENLPAYQAELETITGLEKKLAESRLILEGLTIRAPLDGRVVSRELKSLPGKWLEVGDEILAVVPNEKKELLISFRQEDIDDLAEQTGRDIRIRLRGRVDEFSGVIDRIESRATRAVPHEVMAAPNGGPLALRASTDPLADREREISDRGRGYSSDLDYFSGLGSQSQRRELARARFAGRAKIDSEVEAELNEGEWGYVRFANAEKERLGSWMYQEVSGYVREKIEQARAASTM